MIFEADPSSAGARALASCAAAAVEAVIEAGAARLIAEPWRVSRIIRGADGLSLEQLRIAVRRRRALPYADFNRALAFAQLARALDQPSFAAAWSSNRTRSDPPTRQILPASTA
jgi:hypothetical protein